MALTKVQLWLFISMGLTSALVIVAIIVFIILSSKSGGVLALNDERVAEIMGDVCSKVSDCKSGEFCSESGRCESGSASDIGGNCTDKRTCLYGTYCNGNNVCVAEPAETLFKCTTTADCSVGYTCSSTTCVETILSVIDSSSCTKVPVYRTVLEARRQFIDSTSPAGGSSYYPNSSPIWYGCSQAGDGKVGLYKWVAASNGDVVWSSSTVKPFTGGTTYNGKTYTLQSGPALYIFTSPAQGLLPLYRLSGHQTDTNEYYHTTLLNGTIINNAAWSEIVYNSDADMFPAGTSGLLGYAYLS